MINFKDVELLSVLPENLSRPETQALSAAVKHGLQSLQRYARAAPLYAAIEELPEEALNLLAVELRVQYYEPDAKRKVREGMIKQTVAWYLRGGTGSVLEEYLGTLFQGGTLQEWYAYGGKPYFFKAIVGLGLSDVIAVGDGEKIIDRIHTYKNVRSWLEALMFRIGADYEVPIRYDNAVRLQTQFHPRYNLAYLHLDGYWPLDNSRKLNGYNGSEKLDFYPVRTQVSTAVAADIQFGQRMKFCNDFSVELREEWTVHLQAEADETVQTEERMIIPEDVEFETVIGMAIHTQQSVRREVKAEGMIQLHSEAAEAAQAEGRLRTCTGAAYAVEAASYMTKMNQTDALWSLDGSRKLDGGRYVL